MFNAVCVNELIGLFMSLVLSTLSNPKLVLNPEIEDEPVPPFAIATMPVTFVALPNKLPLNLPLASRLTILFAKLSEVALFAKVTPATISSFVLFPIFNTVGSEAVPPKSPANNIFPLLVVVAS